MQHPGRPGRGRRGVIPDRLQRRLGRLLHEGGSPLAVRRAARAPTSRRAVGSSASSAPRRTGSVVYFQDGSGAGALGRGLDRRSRLGCGCRRPEHLPAGHRRGAGQRRRHEARLRLGGAADRLRQHRSEHRPAGLARSSSSTHRRPRPDLRLLQSPSSEAPIGASTIPGAVANGTAPGSTASYKPRVLSADGRPRVLRLGATRSSTSDSNANPVERPEGVDDVYEWEASRGGNLLPGGRMRLDPLQRLPARGRLVRRRLGRRQRRLLPHRARASSKRTRARWTSTTRGSAAASRSRPRRSACEGDCLPDPAAGSAESDAGDPGAGAGNPRRRLPQVLPEGIREAQRDLREDEASTTANAASTAAREGGPDDHAGSPHCWPRRSPLLAVAALLGQRRRADAGPGFRDEHPGCLGGPRRHASTQKGCRPTTTSNTARAPSFAGAAENADDARGDRVRREQAGPAAIAGARSRHHLLLPTRRDNSSGTTTGITESFKTTAGFGLLPGEEGFSAAVYADGGEPATESGTHPYQTDLQRRLQAGRRIRGPARRGLPRRRRPRPANRNADRADPQPQRHARVLTQRCSTRPASPRSSRAARARTVPTRLRSGTVGVVNERRREDLRPLQPRPGAGHSGAARLLPVRRAGGHRRPAQRQRRRQLLARARGEQHSPGPRPLRPAS